MLENLQGEKHRESTKEQYHKIWTNFNKFLLRLDRRPNTWEEKVAWYCTYLVQTQGTQSSTIKTYVSAIKDVLISDGYDWKDNKMLMSAITSSCSLKNDHVMSKNANPKWIA